MITGVAAGAVAGRVSRKPPAVQPADIARLREATVAPAKAFAQAKFSFTAWAQFFFTPEVRAAPAPRRIVALSWGDMGEGGVETDAPTIVASLGEMAAPIIASEGVEAVAPIIAISVLHALSLIFTAIVVPRIMKDIFKRQTVRETLPGPTTAERAERRRRPSCRDVHTYLSISCVSKSSR